MAKLIVALQKILVGKTNLTSMVRSFSWAAKGESLDSTTLGVSTKTKMCGIPDAELSVDGFFETGADTLDSELFAAVDAGEEPVVTVLSKTSLAGDPAHMFKALAASYQPLGEVGQITPFKASFTGNGKVLCGKNLFHGTATNPGGTGSAVQHVAVGAAQKLYVGINVTGDTSGSGLVVIVQSDDNAGFTSPVSRLTTVSSDVKGSAMYEVAGPITDTYYRIVYVVSAGSFEITVAIAVA